jgi:hypothetical protein
MSSIAFKEYQLLENLLNTQREDVDKDTWHYQWGNSLSVSKAYVSLIQSDQS